MTERAHLDHYPTPRSALTPLLALAEREAWWHPGDTVLDPSAGDGALLDVMAERGHPTVGIELHAKRATEARRKGHAIGRGDALVKPWPACHVIVMNPPYTHAEAFVRRALEHRGDRGALCALLRLSFLGSKRRASLHLAAPANVYVLSSRPRFDGRGNDTADCAWFVWGRGGGGRWGVLEP